MPIKRWAAILKDGSIVGVGATPSKFQLSKIMFISGGIEEWTKQGSRFTRLLDGNLAKIFQRGAAKENISAYKHKRIRRYRGRIKER